MYWDDGCLRLLNQTLLPSKLEYIDCYDYRRVALAIQRLEVRGAPAIGAAAAFALLLGAYELTSTGQDLAEHLPQIAQQLKATRPTAVNLEWALKQMMYAFNNTHEHLAALEKTALAIFEADRRVNLAIAHHGLSLFPESISTVLTHCNAGALATVEYGTALGVIVKAWQQGKISRVFADETRPLLQGARLTAWELSQQNIPVTLITDSMAGWVMRNRLVDMVVVGADRITANGDVANKIGTYSLAVLAKEHNIPFYVAAPHSTFDFSLATGDLITIEERDPSEIKVFAGQAIAPDGVDVFNPAFDITPNSLVSGIITEYGVLKPPYSQAIAQIQDREE